MIRRIVDLMLATLALILFAPVMCCAAVGIYCSSRTPILYRAWRVGQDGRLFIMFKFRTMHKSTGGEQSAVTAGQDSRIFPFGALLRKMKIDELPQLWNILRGEMALIGPRAEDPAIVEKHYRPVEWETLLVPPGLSSPGSLYYFVHMETAIAEENPETWYAREALPLKLALDRVYVRHASLIYDLGLIGRTVTVIIRKLAGRPDLSDPPEMAEARQLLCEREVVVRS